MNETEFHSAADLALNRIFTALEEADESAALPIEDVDLQGGIITLKLENGKTYIINKHTAMRQVWVSSPISGGLHFRWEAERWIVLDGRELMALLSNELGIVIP